MSSTPQLPPGLEAQAGPQNANQQDNARQQGENQENAVNSMLSQVITISCNIWCFFKYLPFFIVTSFIY
ncbi:hypothetical protein ANCCAN_27962 [Ancylostoma caninum]|uniref:Uncharacterized protein n=1 Tax=Ancylostoma caninum TaxID=29170 RepID=A0A368F2N4_ANCCA|nr:hypothetical protein ANCCAN_27962 [Ancylostoma caninum]